MTIENTTPVSSSTGAANVIDYSIGLRLLLQFVERIAIADEALVEEAIKQTEALQTLATEAVKQTEELQAHTPRLERIAVSAEGLWQCCRNSTAMSEEFLEINMMHSDESPDARWTRYQEASHATGS